MPQNIKRTTNKISLKLIKLQKKKRYTFVKFWGHGLDKHSSSATLGDEGGGSPSEMVNNGEMQGFCVNNLEMKNEEIVDSINVWGSG